MLCHIRATSDGERRSVAVIYGRLPVGACGDVHADHRVGMAPIFQAGHAGSIPVARSYFRRQRTYNRRLSTDSEY